MSLESWKSDAEESFDYIQTGYDDNVVSTMYVSPGVYLALYKIDEKKASVVSDNGLDAVRRLRANHAIGDYLKSFFTDCLPLFLEHPTNPIRDTIGSFAAGSFDVTYFMLEEMFTDRDQACIRNLTREFMFNRGIATVEGIALDELFPHTFLLIVYNLFVRKAFNPSRTIGKKLFELIKAFIEPLGITNGPFHEILTTMINAHDAMDFFVLFVDDNRLFETHPRSFIHL